MSNVIAIEPPVFAAERLNLADEGARNARRPPGLDENCAPLVWIKASASLRFVIHADNQSSTTTKVTDMPGPISSERSLPRYTPSATAQERRLSETNQANQARPSDVWASVLPSPTRIWTNLSDRVSPPPGYTRHPQLRQKAANQGALWGAGLGAVGGLGGTAFAIFGVAKWHGQGGYVAGRGAGYILTGSFFAGALVGSAVGYGIGWAVGGIVDETLIAADHVGQAAHVLHDRWAHRHDDAGPQYPEPAFMV